MDANNILGQLSDSLPLNNTPKPTFGKRLRRFAVPVAAFGLGALVSVLTGRR